MLAQRLMGASGGANISSFSYTDSLSIDRADSASSFTFSSVSIGAADTNRTVIIGVYGFRVGAVLGAITDVTVNGVSATQYIARNASNSVSVSLTMYAISVQTGTTATIVVSHGAATTCAIGVFRMVSKNGVVAPANTNSNATNPSTSPISTTIQVDTQNSAVMAFGGQVNGSDPTWTGVTKSFGIDARTDEWVSGGLLYPSVTTGSLSVSMTAVNAQTASILAASWN
jgi:phosphoribosylformylglycinamidine (FGAM) synthase-like amidotransferase family enzyme